MKQADREMVFDPKLERLRALSERPRLSSLELPWRGYLVEQHFLPSFESSDVVWLNNVVFLQLKNPVNLELKKAGAYVPKRVLPGQIAIRPSSFTTSARTRDDTEFLAVSLEPSFMSMTCYELAEGGDLELEVRDGVNDRFIEGVCLALKEEVERGGASGKLYSESLAASLSIHLVRRYGVHKRELPAVPKGLPPQLVRRAMEYMTERLSEQLSLAEIAASVELSPFHFARVFKRSVGLSAFQFLNKQRVEQAKHLLLRGKLSIAATAVRVGFYDQSHLALHFKRLSGMTPKEFVDRYRPHRKSGS